MIVWILIVIGLVTIDQVSKLLIVNTFASYAVGAEKTIPIIQDFFHFSYVENTGAVFGLGGDTTFGMYFFLVTAIVATFVFGYMLLKSDFKNKKKFWYTLSLALLIAGTLGNFLDRSIHSYVIDFIDFRGIWIYVFNFADMCLNVGIALFLIDQFFLEPKRNKTNETT
ncbi:MAG: signal peptidase II [Firmicutes bacterium]|nr:signal peptidase II [Bacillota bacterium]